MHRFRSAILKLRDQRERKMFCCFQIMQICSYWWPTGGRIPNSPGSLGVQRAALKEIFRSEVNELRQFEPPFAGLNFSAISDAAIKTLSRLNLVQIEDLSRIIGNSGQIIFKILAICR